MELTPAEVDARVEAEGNAPTDAYVEAMNKICDEIQEKLEGLQLAEVVAVLVSSVERVLMFLELTEKPEVQAEVIDVLTVEINTLLERYANPHNL